ncbi:uncharacterized protein GLRG_04633 [Colletotrichum graminicola M1.001]|uniref:Uncharacterized protein n=1 Tax=Colletotrichum graminicola (strain M1.001 / M2 / FGSC 10212) TaxID=645133 RepID=E3QF51_COLGM|nr:uncharacterized protein GLRG_04633 [Colletotrichum graminicola M1.001]EFQ29489.1 hypothetical protein GLRG_04633 [Colletotrichum graminicola M1.001]
MEAVRILNGLVLPDEIVGMLAKAGWDAEKCCNPKLTREERKLGAGPADLKRSLEDENEFSSQSKKQKTAAAVFQKEPSKARNSPEIPVPTDENFRESSLLITEVIVKTEEELPKPIIPRPAGSFHVYDAPGEKARNNGLGNYFHREGIEIDTNAAAINKSQTVDMIVDRMKLPRVAKPPNPMSPSPRGVHEIDAMSSISSMRRKHTSRRELKRAMDNVNNNLAVFSAGESIKLQQAAQIRQLSEKLEYHSDQLQKHTEQLQRQDSVLAQIRHDNQALRSCLQEALPTLSWAVNALRKSSKGDKRARKSAKKSAEKGLKDFKSAAKNTEVLKQSFEHLCHVIGAAEGRHGGKNDAQGQGN